MELHELHVAQSASRLGREPHRIAGVLVAARRGAAPDPRVAARGEHDCVGDDEPAAAVVDVEPVGAEDAAVVDEQPRDVDVVAHLHADGQRALDEDALDLAAGVVAGEARPPVAVGAEEALRQPAVLLACEPGAPAHEVVDRPRRLAGEDLDARRIGEPVALAQRVGRVLLPAVLGIHRPERGVDPAGGEHRVRVVAAALADAEHLHAALRELDRRPQPRRAGADDEDARRHPPLLARALIGRLHEVGADEDGDRQSGPGEGNRGERREQLRVGRQRGARNVVRRRRRPADLGEAEFLRMDLLSLAGRTRPAASGGSRSSRAARR